MDDKFYEELSRLINGAFDGTFGRRAKNHLPKPKNTMETTETTTLAKENTPIYESIEDYTTKTGKRFRMTKQQKSRNLSREEAFTETFGGSN